MPGEQLAVAVTLLWILIACALFPQVSNAAGGDETRGQATFEKRCTGCHSLNQDKEGPRLQGVYGRRAGTVAGFNYSDALKNSGITWDETSLNKWLTDPDSLVADNDMAFHVSDEKERGDIIAYLKSTSGK